MISAGTKPDQISWLLESSEAGLQICVNLKLYTPTSLFRVCYLFTDRCYLFLEPNKAQDEVTVHFSRRLPNADLAGIVGEFANELINQQVREDIARETRSIRELIVAQAFAEADLLDRTDSNASYIDDPKDIAR